MARRVFSSFHYERDIFRVNQVRNSGMIKDRSDSAGSIDHADWESLVRQSDAAIQRWIDSQPSGASVTVVLIGAETFGRRWVNYEIQRSFSDEKGIFDVRIHQLKDPRTGRTDVIGQNPLEGIYVTGSNPRKYLSQLFPVYDWVTNGGYCNFPSWVESAASKANR